MFLIFSRKLTDSFSNTYYVRYQNVYTYLSVFLKILHNWEKNLKGKTIWYGKREG